MKLQKVNLIDIKPYENNPRRNDGAICALTESIKQCGYISPIILDENHEVLAGHTRLKTLEEMGEHEIECIVLDGMTDDQKRKYRLLDNKLAEIAEWDEEMLEEELKDLDLGNLEIFFVPTHPENDEFLVATDAGKRKEVRCPKCGAVVEEGDDYGAY